MAYALMGLGTFLLGATFTVIAMSGTPWMIVFIIPALIFIIGGWLVAEEARLEGEEKK